VGYYGLVFELCLERMIYMCVYGCARVIEEFKDDKKTKVISLF